MLCDEARTLRRQKNCDVSVLSLMFVVVFFVLNYSFLLSLEACCLMSLFVCFFFFVPMETISSIPDTAIEEALPQKNPRKVPPKRSSALRIIG